MGCSNDCKLSKAKLTLTKTDSNTGKRLGGAVFELVQHGFVKHRGITDSQGLLVFILEPCSKLTLREASPPHGYLRDPSEYEILVDSNNRLFIDGLPQNHLAIQNISAAIAAFTAVKINQATSQPLAGAKFILYADDVPFASATSTEAGLLAFKKLPTRTYELAEVEAPAGFAKLTERLKVVVSDERVVTINGKTAEGYQIMNTPLPTRSQTPYINQIIANSTGISGTGVPGATVTVSFPNGITQTTVVAANGTWMVAVPTGITLQIGDGVSATQTEPGKEQSTVTTTLVVAPANGYGYKYVRNLSRIINFSANDVLEYIVTIGNESSTTTTWRNVLLTDVMHEFINLLPGSIQINGIRARIGTNPLEYRYDETSRTLTVHLGDLEPWDELVITYRVRIVSNWPGTGFSNRFTASSGITSGVYGDVQSTVSDSVFVV